MHRSPAFAALQPRTRALGLLLGVLLLAPPRNARACDPNCDVFGVFVIGGLAAAGTIVVAPLIGLALDRRPQPPYWTALGFTALGAAAGWGFGLAATAPEGEVSDGTLRSYLALPVAMWFAASCLSRWPGASEGARSRNRDQ